jgi:mxaJ protein
MPSVKRLISSLSLLAGFIGIGLVGTQVAWADSDDKPYALRVCQDPSNLPFSNDAGEGYANRIAEVIAKKMGLPLEYYSFPQRLGYFRNTLKFKIPGDSYYRCDVDVNVPVGDGEVTSTKPYYRSTWVLVYAEGRGLDGVKSEDDLQKVDPAALKNLRIGVGDRSPGGAWLLKHGLVEQGVPIPMMVARPDYYPGEVIEHDLRDNKYDAVIVWGPVAGYYVDKVKSPKMVIVPLKSQPGLVLDYAFGMGVRYGEPKWKEMLQKAQDESMPEIMAILREYHVPLVDEHDNLIPWNVSEK